MPFTPSARRGGSRLLRGLLWLTLSIGLLSAASAQAVTIAGERFAETIRLGDADLQLNGVGLRAVAWLNGYAAALYMGQRASTPAQVLAVPGAKRLQLRMLLDVPTEEFVKAFDKGIERNTPAAEFDALRERMAQFDRTIRAIGEVHKGDVVNLDFLPSRGLVLTLNGKSLGEPIPGADLYAALLRIFIGDKPVDTRLKAGLLGAPAT